MLAVEQHHGEDLVRQRREAQPPQIAHLGGGVEPIARFERFGQRSSHEFFGGAEDAERALVGIALANAGGARVKREEIDETPASQGPGRDVADQQPEERRVGQGADVVARGNHENLQRIAMDPA